MRRHTSLFKSSTTAGSGGKLGNAKFAGRGKGDLGATKQNYSASRRSIRRT
jgi:hypothetical protein